jgi:hypothetical protein
MDVPRSLDVGVGVAIWEARMERMTKLSCYFVVRLGVPQGGPVGEVKRLDGFVSVLA